MKPVTLYTKTYCGYSRAAKQFLTEKGVRFQDIDVTADERQEEEMVRRAGGASTVPQIFIGDEHIGGFTDLARLEKQGVLDRMLEDEEQPGAAP